MNFAHINNITAEGKTLKALGYVLKIKSFFINFRTLMKKYDVIRTSVTINVALIVCNNMVYFNLIL